MKTTILLTLAAFAVAPLMAHEGADCKCEKRSDREGKCEKTFTYEEFANCPRIKDKTDAEKKELFDKKDINKDGVLNKEDFKAAREANEAARKAADVDGDGAYTLEEFKNLPRAKDKDAERVAKIFEKLDADKDGKVTPEELKAAKKGHGKCGCKHGDKKEEAPAPAPAAKTE